MRHSIQKHLAVLLALLLLLALTPTVGMRAEALTSGDYEYTVTDGKATITDYTGSGGDITIPSTLGGYTVTAIGDGAFADCHSLTSVTIPNSVASIGKWAFESCSLKSVTIPNSVTSIGYGTFSGCEFLTAITVNNGNAYYASQDGVLFNKNKTTLILYPMGNARTSYSIPNSVTRIGSSAFSSNDSLTIVTIPNCVTAIEDGAFACCFSLASVTIPNSVANIGDRAFYYCASLAAITVNSGNANYLSQDGVLFNKNKTTLIQYPIRNARTSYTIPDSVTSIGKEAFAWCSLTSVAIPHSVTNIGEWAFQRCSWMESVSIPSSVTSIGEHAFNWCDSLTSAKFEGSPPTKHGSDIFATSADGFTIYYPASLKQQWAPNGETSWSDGSLRYPILPYTPVSFGTGTAVHTTLSVPFMVSDNDSVCNTRAVLFDDAFFGGKATTFQYGLAKLSLATAVGTFTKETAKGDSYVRTMLQSYGFYADSIFTKKFDNNTATDDTCAYAFAAKKLPNSTDYLVAVLIRGSGYGPGFGGEWASNVRVYDASLTAYSAGFKKAADGVYAALQDYLTKMNNAGIANSNIRIWTTGFSRGGAVSNLLAAKLVANGGFAQDKVFAYTFATPATVKAGVAVQYPNIFNIVQETDVVPRVPLASWSFTRYGTTLYLPSFTKTGKNYIKKLNQMKQEFPSILSGAKYNHTTYELIPQQEQVIDLLLDYLDDAIPNETFYKMAGVQDALVNACSGQDASWVEIAIRAAFASKTASSIINLLKNWDNLSIGERVSAIRSILKSYDKTQALIPSLCEVIVDLLEHYAARFLADLVTSEDLTYYYDSMFKMLADTIRNSEDSALLMQHWPEVYMAWLDSGSSISLFELKTYTRVCIKCPVDVYIYDSAGAVVVRIVNDVVDESFDERLYAYCNEFGEKEVYLPDDDTYRIEVIAREDGVLDIVSESYSEESALLATEGYFDVEMTQAQQFDVTFVVDEQDCTVVSEGETLTPDVVESGESVSTYTVTINMTGEGYVSGNSTYLVGETATLSALAAEAYIFDGWYDESGVLISADAYYGFSILCDRTIEARFEQGVLGDVNLDGVVTSADASALLRSIVKLDKLSDKALRLANVNRDSAVTSSDAATILRFVAALIDNFDVVA